MVLTAHVEGWVCGGVLPTCGQEGHEEFIKHGNWRVSSNIHLSYIQKSNKVQEFVVE